MSEDIATNQLKQPSPDVNRRACTSAAMIGLAISVGASGLLMPQQGDGAMAAEALPTEPTAATVPTQPDVVVLSSTPEVESSTAFSPSDAATIEHVVREGQTLWDLARLYQVDANAIAASNGIRPGAVLRVGQVLRIPSSNTALTLPAARSGDTVSTDGNGLPQAEYSVASSQGVGELEPQSNGTKDLLKQKQKNALALLKQKREALSSSMMELSSRSTPSTDILSALPQPNQTANPSYPSLESLVEAESLKVQIAEPERSTNLEAGPVREPAQIDPPTQLGTRSEQPKVAVLLKPEAILAPTTSEASVATVYRVSPGDTLDAIARNHNVSRSELVRVNGLKDPNFIRVDQRLKIPASEKGALPSSIATLPKPAIAISSTRTISLPLSSVPVNSLSSSSPTELPVVTVPTSVAPSNSEGISSPAISFNTKVTGEDAQVRNNQALPVLPPSTAVKEPASIQKPTTLASGPVGLSSLSLDDSRSHFEAAPVKVSYVDGLKAEVLQMREKIRAERLGQNTAPAVPVQARVVTTQPVNPEFSTGSYDRSQKVEIRVEQRVGTESPKASAVVKKRQPQGSEQLVATAPMGSDAYDPLIQPLVGQMVSPDLPPLAAASRYLPEHAAEFKGYIWPAKGVLTSGYGWRWGRMHRGIDIAGPIGTPVYAAAPGIVVYSGWNSGGYGNMVEIKHPDGSMTRYAHNSRNVVREGQQVEQGQQIAEMGSTGYSTGPHSHFEIHLPGRGAVNPIALLAR